MSGTIQYVLEQVAREQLEAVEPLDPSRLGPGILAGATGRIAVAGHGLEVTVRVPRGFPADLPHVEVSGLPFRIPHVARDGDVCFAVRQGLVVDRRDPAGVLRQALASALETVEAGLERRNLADFAEEFGAYWGGAPEARVACSAVEPEGGPRVIIALERGEREGGGFVPVAFADDKARLEVVARRLGAGEWRSRLAVYVPMALHDAPTPPPGGAAWTFRDWRAFLHGHLHRRGRKRLGKLLRKAGADAPVVLGVLSAGGTWTLLGLKPPSRSGVHPLLGGSSEVPAVLGLERWDRTYLLPRGGADGRLGRRRVLLVGCGALGGQLAVLLAASGVGSLTLVDPDRLSNDNTFRHVLGRSAAGRPKAEALKHDLEQRFPYLEVSAVAEDVRRALDDGRVRLGGFDLVVLATGEPSLELELNERLRRSPAAPPALFTWLEPLGVGGHALLTGRGGEGCFECLFNPPDHEEAPLFNRASFAAPGQRFTRDLAGCGGAFTPFSYLDAARTAELAARLALQSLTGATPGNRLVSWRGDPGAFLGAGFRLSERWGTPPEGLSLGGCEFRRPDCPVCGAAGGGS